MISKCYITSFMVLDFSEMGTGKFPFEGIIQDVKGRVHCYRQDWTNAISSGARYLLHGLRNLIRLFSTTYAFAFSHLSRCIITNFLCSGYWLRHSTYFLHLLCLLLHLENNLVGKQVILLILINAVVAY